MLCRYIKLSLILIIMALCYNTVSSSEATASTLEDEYRINNPLHVVAGPEEAKDVRRRLQTVNEEAFGQVLVDVPADPTTGPWPECLGMNSDDCIQFIESKAQDIYTVVVLPIETERTRVWVSVDDNGKVNKVPYRG
jgi:hypothetical protein